MSERKTLLRTAGILYLLVVVSGMYALAYVPSQLINRSNPVATFEQISGEETLFRSGIGAAIVCYAAFVFLPIVLYHLFKTVNKYAAQAMCVLALLSIPLSFSNLTTRYTVLSLLEQQRETLGDVSQFAGQIMQQLSLYDTGILLSLFFWGSWLLPLGYLFYKSGFTPKFLGVLLVAGGLGHLINFFGHTLLVHYAELGVSKYIKLLPAVAEIGTCVWLLVAGFSGFKKQAV
ncbi:MAG: DUF4386 domain-containing protein [Bacteroidetes bacterium]|nr:DUF4386 domain-containing protein [Bacteroidota bacterium]